MSDLYHHVLFVSRVLLHLCVMCQREYCYMASDICCLLQTEEPVSTFIQCEEEARKGHTGIWIHGDPGSESDEEDAAPSKSAWGRR